MSDLLPLKETITYGPVRSRRLGRSLGINLLPPAQKLCTFDCLYCQYGWTPAENGGRDERPPFPPLEKVVQAVETAVRELHEAPAYLTFSGNGEPTLHPDFSRIAEAVRALRDRIAPEAKTALLSNAGRVGDPAVRRAIARLDRPILKFDAGNATTFRSYNRPAAGVLFDDIVAGLKEMRNITLQALFTTGRQGNIEEGHVADWIEAVKKIQPLDVQIYTISRPIPSRTIAPASAAAMLDIRDRLRRQGIPAEVF